MGGSAMKVGDRTFFVPFTLMLLLLLLLIGCAGKSRIHKFGQISKSYQRALEMSDYRVASKYVDPSGVPSAAQVKRYANIQIVQYTIANVHVSEDKQSIEQDVELQYYLLDQNRLKTANDHQVWRYKEGDKVWVLQTGLPSLDR
jgi:hypothetical protein